MGQDERYKYELGNIYDNLTDAAIYLADDEKLTVKCNDGSFFSMLGYSENEFCQMLESSFINCIYAPDRKLIIEKIKQNEGGVIDENIRLMDKHARVIWYNAKLIRTADDNVFFCVLNDITEFKISQTEFETQSRFMDLIHTSIEGGTRICFDDRKMSITYVSEEFMAFLGYTKKELMNYTNGYFFNLICESDRDEVRETIDSWFKSGDYYEVEYRIKKKNGTLVWVEDKGKRIKNENGDYILVSLVIDINNTRQIISRLEKANNDLKSLQNSIPVSFGKIALLEDGMYIISANKQLMDFFAAYDENVFDNMFIAYDAINVNQVLISEIALRREESIEIEIGNSRRWFMMRGTLEKETYKDRYTVYYMMFTDISGQKENRVQVEMEKEKYQKITEITDDIVFEYDCLTDIMVYSDKYKQIMNKPSIYFNFKESLYGKKSETGYIDFGIVFNSIFSGNEFFRSEFNVKLENDKDIWIEIAAKGIYNENGKVIKIIGILRDIDKQKKEQILLYDKSRIDLLSGLYNKISTQEEIEAKINLINAGMYAGLLMIDIDNFKSINDLYGHMVGDEVIVKIAKFLKDNFGKYGNVIGRVGGDEFQVFMTNILDEKMIVEKADVLCRGINKLFEDSKTAVTVSVGVYYTNRQVSYESLYQKADIALYNAKSKGKNRYELYETGHKNDNLHDNVQEMLRRDAPFINPQILLSMLKTVNEDDCTIDMCSILGIVGTELDVDRIIINEIDNDRRLYSVAYEWHAAHLNPLAAKLQNRALDNYVVFNENNSDVIAYYQDDMEWYNDRQKLFFKQSGFKGIVQVPLSRNGKIFSYIEFVTLNEKRVFTSRELCIMDYISSIIKYNIFVSIGRKRMFLSVEGIIGMPGNECESFIRINMSDFSYEKYIFNNGNFELLETGDDFYAGKFDMESMMVIGNKRQEYIDAFSKESLVKLCESGEDVSISLEYEMDTLGSSKWVKRCAKPVRARFDICSYVIIALFDISAGKKAEKKNNDEKMQIIKEQLAARYIYDEILEIDVEENTVGYIFRKSDSPLAFSPEIADYNTMITYSIEELVFENDREALREILSLENIKQYFDSDIEPINMYFRRIDKSGNYVWICMNIIDISRETGSDMFLVMFRLDQDYNAQMNMNSRLISINHTLESNEENIRNKARFDNLTGIYNIEEFYRACEKLISEEKEYNLAIVRMDIDKFKLINDLYGYDVGDEILKYAANVIRTHMNGMGVYGRMNSDIFCMCVRFKERSEIISLIDKIVEGLSSYDAKYRISSYYGICIIEDKSVDIGVICDWANMALRKIKGSNIVRYAYYDNNMRMMLLEERKFESQMEYALESGQFEAYLQPQYDIRSSKINGAEALIRWNHPQEGIISPGRFVPLFERNGFIIKVDEFMWREACKTLRRWIDDGYTPVPISVNVSRLHMFDDELCSKLVALLNEFNLPRHMIMLEVTETIMYDDSEAMNRTLNRLRNLGFQIAMDDFGSGYSSLNMLENMCVDELKIDGAFLSRTSSTENGKAIVKFIIAMAKQLNLKIVAEGVKNEEQAAMLLEFGCYNAQGYYYSRPVPINKFEAQAFDANAKK